MAYNFGMVGAFFRFHQVFLAIMILTMLGCATRLPSVAQSDQISGGLVAGRVVAVLTGKRSRRYLPEVRFVELENQASQKRFQVDIKSSDQYFAVDLPPGDYRLTRVQISEGPFMSMADLSMTFSVDADAITYVGTWRFAIDSPRYGRMVMASVVADQVDVARSRDFLDDQYSTFERRSVVETLPQPVQM